MPGGLDEFVDLAIPALQRREFFRRECEGDVERQSGTTEAGESALVQVTDWFLGSTVGTARKALAYLVTYTRVVATSSAGVVFSDARALVIISERDDELPHVEIVALGLIAERTQAKNRKIMNGRYGYN